jgi:acyl-CoA thioesterase FadM
VWLKRVVNQACYSVWLERVVEACGGNVWWKRVVNQAYYSVWLERSHRMMLKHLIASC